MYSVVKINTCIIEVEKQRNCWICNSIWSQEELVTCSGIPITCAQSKKKLLHFWVSQTHVNVLPATSFMERSCREANSHSASKEIFGLSVNPKVHYCLYKSLPLVHLEPDDSSLYPPAPTQWMYAFSTEFWALQTEPMWGSLLYFHNIVESVTTTVLLQRTRRMEVTWCEVTVVWQILETCPSKLQQQSCSLSGCVESWHQVTFVVVTDAKLMSKCKKLYHWFCSKIPEFYVEGIYSLITCCDKCINLQVDYMKK